MQPEPPATEIATHMPDIESWIKEYESRSLGGRLSFLAESGAKLVSSTIESIADQTSAVISRTKKSFERGLDPEITDATILEEHVRRHEQIKSSEREREEQAL